MRTRRSVLKRRDVVLPFGYRMLSTPSAGQYELPTAMLLRFILLVIT